MSKQYFEKTIKFNLPDGLKFAGNGMNVEYIHAPHGSMIAENGGGLTKNPEIKNGNEFDISYWFDGLERGDQETKGFFYYNAIPNPASMSCSLGDPSEPPTEIVWFYQVVLSLTQDGVVGFWSTLFTFPIGMEKYYNPKTNTWHNRYWSGNMVTKFGVDNKVWLMCETVAFPGEVYYMKINLEQSEDENTCIVNVELPVKS